MFRWALHNKGQAIFEYAVILGLVALALGMMQVYLRRGIQAGIKITADELALQKDSEEVDPTKGTGQSSLVRRESPATRKIQHGQGNSQSITITVDETNKIIEVNKGIPSESSYWSNWEEQ